MSEVTTKSQELALLEAGRTDWPEEYQALRTDRERAFVLLYMQDGNAAKAAREAKYGNEAGTSTAEPMARIAYRLTTTQRIVDAIQAVAKRQIRSLAPSVVSTLKHILSQPFHKDAGKIALALAEKIEPTRQVVSGEIKHVHSLDHEGEAEAQYRTLRALGVAREKLVEVFGEFGLERLEAKIASEAKPVIDAEYEEVPRDPDAELFGE